MSDIPPRVRPEDFDALTAAMERCEATALRVAETRKRLKLDEDEKTKRLRAEIADLRRRLRQTKMMLFRFGLLNPFTREGARFQRLLDLRTKKGKR